MKCGWSLIYLGDYMPIYSMQNTETDEIFELNIKYSELETYLQENPTIKQIFTRFPGYCDSVRMGVRRVDDGFKDVLTKAKTAHKHSTVNNF